MPKLNTLTGRLDILEDVRLARCPEIPERSRAACRCVLHYLAMRYAPMAMPIQTRTQIIEATELSADEVDQALIRLVDARLISECPYLNLKPDGRVRLESIMWTIYWDRLDALGRSPKSLLAATPAHPTFGARVDSVIGARLQDVGAWIIPDDDIASVRSVLMAFAVHIPRADEPEPVMSYEDLASLTGLSRKRVERACNLLMGAGLVHGWERTLRDGSKSASWVVQWPRLIALAKPAAGKQEAQQAATTPEPAVPAASTSSEPPAEAPPSAPAPATETSAPESHTQTMIANFAGRTVCVSVSLLPT